MSNWRGEGTVAVKPGQASENECRTELLRRVGDRGLERAFRGHQESMQTEAALAVFWQ